MQRILQYFPYFSAILENMEISLFLLVLDYKQQFLDLQNDLVALVCGNDPQF